MTFRYAMALVLLCLIALLTACGERQAGDPNDAPRWVRLAPVVAADAASAGLSGTVQARFETPLAFQVAGRIQERLVDAGVRVDAGQVLFRLDPRDLEQAVNVAQADLDAAQAELNSALAETRRNRDLLAREFISEQVFERVELAEIASRKRVEAASARLQQARNALDYAELQAPYSGVLSSVSGEPGQVLATGESVAMLASDDPTEIEVFLPEALGFPERGRIVSPALPSGELRLREVAGSADSVTRTWAARYQLAEPAADLRLGSVVRVALELPDNAENLLQMPVSAINERGSGPRVWRILDGRAQSVEVLLLDLDREHARIVAELEPGSEVIALGTHLLTEGMPVRALEDRR